MRRSGYTLKLPPAAGPERFFARPARGILLGVTVLAIVAVMALLVPAEPLTMDRRWSDAMQEMRTPPLTNLALLFNELGRGLGWVLSLAVVAAVLAVSRRWLALTAFALAETLTPLSSSLLKALIGRPRPPNGLVQPVGSSFPSGHAAYAAATCTALVLMFTTPGTGRRLWWTLAAVGIIGMAWSRTYLQVHWLSDVIGGSMLGIGISLVVLATTQRWDERRSRAIRRFHGSPGL